MDPVSPSNLTLIALPCYNTPIMSSLSDTATSRPGIFIALEGVDGSGKTTQARLLADWCRERGRVVTLTREPGGTPLGERLRAVILDPEIACTARAELLMILAARAQHVAEVIAPALAAGHVVITDRFSLSSFAYQGYGRGIPLEEIRAADAVATAGCHPDLTLVIAIPFAVLQARIGARRDRFEGEGAEFLQRVITGYHALSAGDTAIRLLDGTGSVETVQQAVRQAVGACWETKGDRIT